MIRQAVIADDLTGAADTGIQFGRFGNQTLLVPHKELAGINPGSIKGVLAVTTESRNLSPAAAGERVRQTGMAVGRLGPQMAFKKIDSCMRGNIGAEVAALADAFGCRGALIAPAFPAQGRITLHDVHYVHNIPVADSEMARDPVSPVRASRLSALIALQYRQPVGRIDAVDLDGDPWRLKTLVEGLLKQGRRLIVCDAAHQRHLEVVARLANDQFPHLLLAGSAGLAQALVRCQFEGTEVRPASMDAVGEHLLFVCGSGSDVLKSQVEALTRKTGIPRHIMVPGRSASPSDRSDAIAKDLASGAVVLQLAPAGSLVYDNDAARQLAAETAAIVRHLRPDGLFLSGGDTAAAVLGAIEASAIRLQVEILPGVIQGTVIGGTGDGLPVITKAGAFGEPDTLLQLYGLLADGRSAGLSG
ncbi:MAG: four-carbon acid sugar kinase family protein [Desulfobacterales bacterium]